jgi:hypothetical protein
VSTNGTTPVTLVSSPASGVQRGVDLISVVNTDTGAGVVTIRYNDNGTTYALASYSLGAGEKLEYTSANGWRTFANSGAIKQSLNQGNSPVTSEASRSVLASNVVNNNAVANSLQDLTGLSVPVNSGNTYYFRFVIKYTSELTTNGSRWTLYGPTFTDLTAVSRYSLAATTQTFSTVNSYAFPTASNTGSASTLGNIALIEGFITPSADGDLIIRFASELANRAITAMAGSFVEYFQIS